MQIFDDTQVENPTNTAPDLCLSFPVESLFKQLGLFGI